MNPGAVLSLSIAIFKLPFALWGSCIQSYSSTSTLSTWMFFSVSTKNKSCPATGLLLMLIWKSFLDFHPCKDSCHFLIIYVLIGPIAICAVDSFPLHLMTRIQTLWHKVNICHVVFLVFLIANIKTKVYSKDYMDGWGEGRRENVDCISRTIFTFTRSEKR